MRVAKEVYPDCSNIKPCLMSDEVTTISRFINNESDAEGIKDLEHLRKELDLYQR